MTPQIFLIRHGETEWSKSGQHTGKCDIPLTQQGEKEARALAPRLAGLKLEHVYTSPLQRAAETCRLAGCAAAAQIDRDLMEWNYGDYEGKTRAEIYARDPEWKLWSTGCPGGEVPAQVAARADRVIVRLRAMPADHGPVALFSHSHFLRVFAARWLGQPADFGRLLYLGTASVSLLSYEHNNLNDPVIALWNERIE